MATRRRIRDWLEVPGRFAPGPRNAITDVPSVAVGHTTIREGVSVRTGITVIRPHGGDPFRDRCPAAVHAGNGFGKLTGALQIVELGELESIIALTNTLSVPQAMQGLLEHHLATMPTEAVSINVVVGETNDGYLNDIKRCYVQPHHVREAVESVGVEVTEGAVGAGTGTCCFGYKGGIGTSSRVVPSDVVGTTSGISIGAIVQSNYTGNLTLYGTQLPLGSAALAHDGGSCMIVVATDAPLDNRQLTRLARRGIVGLTRTGSYLAHNSGDFCIAFSNHTGVRRRLDHKSVRQVALLDDDRLSPLFEAVTDVVQEALYNSLTMAESTSGFQGRRAEGFDPAAFADVLTLKVED